MGSGVIIGMNGCVGNGDGVMVASINVDVGTSVGETTVGIGVSVGKMIVCCPQADNVTSRIIPKIGFI